MALLEKFWSVRKKLLVTVFLDHPVLYYYYTTILFCANFSFLLGFVLSQVSLHPRGKGLWMWLEFLVLVLKNE